MSGQRQSSRLLINEAPLQVLPSLAAAIGLNEAIVLQQIHFLLSTREAAIADSTRWITRSMEAWALEFPWWNVKTVKRIFTNLRKLKLIITGKFNQNKWDHTLWYRVDYDALEALTPVPVDRDKMSPSEGDNLSQSEGDKSVQSSILDKKESKDSLEPAVPDASHSKRKANPVYDWVAVNVFKVTPESAEQDKDIHKWIGANSAKLVNAEKRLLSIPEKKPLTDEQRTNLAAQLPGMLTFWCRENPGITSPPQAKPSFAKLVIQWYTAGKPFAAPPPIKQFEIVPTDDWYLGKEDAG